MNAAVAAVESVPPVMQGEPAKLTDSTTATMFGGDKKGWGKVIEIHCGMEQMLFAVSSHPFQH